MKLAKGFLKKSKMKMNKRSWILYFINPMIIKMFLSYTITFAIVELGSKICHSIDGLMVSNLLGDTAMAAHGLTAPYTTMIEIVSAIIVTGAQDMITRAAGKGDKKGQTLCFRLRLKSQLCSLLL